MKKIFLTALTAMCFVPFAKAEQVWNPMVWEQQLAHPAFTFKLDEVSTKALLAQAGNNLQSAVRISLPTPDGKVATFKIWRNSLIPAALQQKFPDVWSFTAVNVSHTAMTAKIEFSPRGLYAMIFDGDNTYFIDPLHKDEQAYKAYYKREALMAVENMAADCQVLPDEESLTDAPADHIKTAPYALGTVRRTYRLALSCTGEYAVAVAGPNPSKADVFAAMTTSMNRVNGIYEREMAVTMEFIPNNDTLIFTDPTTDPFTANNNGSALLSQNQSSTTTRVGSANYDIGHIFSTGAGGIAMLGSVCRNNNKAMGVTGRPNPVGDPFDVDYVAHEIGHQFGADHSFNTCSGTENSATAYEPGSGSTIMAYAGICGMVNNLQSNSNDYFHRISLNNFNTYLGSRSPGTCPVVDSGYNAPIFTVPTTSYYIPKMTPFSLEFPEVSFTDTGATILVNIEQFNRGNFQQNENLGGTFVTGPSLRSFPPDTVASRTFPRLVNLRQGLLSVRGERLAEVGRNYNFAYTARAIHADGWGSLEAAGTQTAVRVDSFAGPFTILYPNDRDSIVRNSNTTIYWDVAGSDLAPINCAEVDILLSLDDGITFPIILASNVPNIGTATVAIPDVSSTTARVKVQASNNIFFTFSKTRVVIGDQATAPPNTGIADKTKQALVQVYPNPTDGILNIQVDNTSGAKLSLINTIGQVVWQSEMRNQSQYQLDTRGLAKGFYILKYETGAQQGNIKVLVQ